MKSYEALATAINRHTPDHAKALHLCNSMVNKWQEANNDFSDSGAYNPLDRLETIIETSIKLGNPIDTALAPVFYLGQHFNFLPLILPAVPPNFSDISKQLNHLVKSFGSLLEMSADALEDGRITPDERRDLDRCAHKLQSTLSVFMSQVAEVAK